MAKSERGLCARILRRKVNSCSLRKFLDTRTSVEQFIQFALTFPKLPFYFFLLTAVCSPPVLPVVHEDHPVSCRFQLLLKACSILSYRTEIKLSTEILQLQIVTV